MSRNITLIIINHKMTRLCCQRLKKHDNNTKASMFLLLIFAIRTGQSVCVLSCVIQSDPEHCSCRRFGLLHMKCTLAMEASKPSISPELLLDYSESSLESSLDLFNISNNFQRTKTLKINELNHGHESF